MRMPFKHDEPMSRLERMRCEAQMRASGAAHNISSAASTAASASRNAATNFSGVAQTAAHQASGVAQNTAHQIADRARPVAAEAAVRGAAAWDILRHGAPQPSGLRRMTSVLPVAAVGSAAGAAARKSRAPFALMAIGGIGAAGVMWWRRSRMHTDSVWIMEDDSDIEAAGGWHEGPSRTGRSDSAQTSGSSAKGTPEESMAEADRKDTPSHRWP